MKIPSPKTVRKQASLKTVRGIVEKNPDFPRKNPSLACLESILRLPKINKEYKVDIVDENFTIRYFENKKRVQLTYRPEPSFELQKRKGEEMVEENVIAAGAPM
jgi:hypothetical protein